MHMLAKDAIRAAVVVLLTLGVVLGGANARAQDNPNPGPEEPWQWSFTPYLWAAGIKGDNRIGSLPTASIDQSFGDVLDNLDFSFMGAVEVRRGKWMLWLDTIYLSLSQDGALQGPNYSKANLDVEQTMVSMSAGYRVWEGPLLLDALGGARYTRVRTDLTLAPGLLPQLNASHRGQWWDPLVGLRAQLPLGQGWSLVGYSDIGGFDLGSRLTWQFLVGINYQFSQHLVARVGYRYLYTDYDHDDYLYDMTISGPYLGLGIVF